MNNKTIQAMQQHGVAAEVDTQVYSSVVDIFQRSTTEFSSQNAFSSLGHCLTYADLQRLAKQFAGYLQQHTNLQPGDRVAVQLPNLIQYPVIMHGILLAGMVLVNTNPLYTARELKHQLNDSGAKAIVVLANIADVLQEVVADTEIEQVIVTELADLHPWPKRVLINSAAKYIKNMVPKLNLPNAIPLNKALKLGASATFSPVAIEPEQLAVLQYTGGTTGVAKGAMLTHRNLVANVLQCMAVFDTYQFEQQSEILVVPLPLYHIYSFTNCMVIMATGNHCVLNPNPRDTASLIKDMRRYPMTAFCGINTLFVSLCNHPDFNTVDFSKLRLTLSGGMALTADAAKRWAQATGCEVYQGYGLTEASPVLTVNPGNGNQISTIGLPLPSTQIKLVDAQGDEVAEGEVGELCVKGPQVMKGYWQLPDATAEMLSSDGWLHTGDIAEIQSDGYLKIVDRKKDMIIVSGFNVFPNELEDVLSEHPKVVECAAIGVPDDVSGETITMYVVASEEVTAEELKAFCKARLTAYKVPKRFEFRDDLPKSAVGKILRRELR